MKHWRDYPPNFHRITTAAVNGGYRAEFPTSEQAHAIVRTLQKFAAAVRRDPEAPDDLRAAVAPETGGVLWHLPKPSDDGTWIIQGARKPLKRASIESLAAKLP